jgi:predicted lipid-binding transport protein (Tim44 family)
MERTMTQPSQPGSTAAARPATTPGAQPGGLFNRPGFLGGLAAGFLGAGLIGLLMGNGLAGGLGGLASFFGLLLQIGLVVIVGYLLWSWWQRRSQPAHAMAGGPPMSDVASERIARYSATAPMGLGGGSVPSMTPAAQAAAATDEIGIKPEDFDAFERLLGDVQTAYGNEDLAALRARVTPEMLSYFAEDLAENTSRGVVNTVADVKLLQGDLSEAWREGNTEYATVAMRYSLVDQMVERASGRVVEGGPDEATEVWTFMRARGGQWVLSAIQQV